MCLFLSSPNLLHTPICKHAVHFWDEDGASAITPHLDELLSVTGKKTVEYGTKYCRYSFLARMFIPPHELSPMIQDLLDLICASLPQPEIRFPTLVYWNPIG